MLPKNYILLEDCIEGHVYSLNSRNLTHGVYTKGGFIGVRSKFGREFLDKEWHYDIGDGTTGTARPIKDLGPLKDKLIKVTINFDHYECDYCGMPMRHEKDDAHEWYQHIIETDCYNTLRVHHAVNQALFSEMLRVTYDSRD